MADSSIQWTDKVWNPTIGCSRVSAGCGDGAVKGGGCYAERMAHRLATMPHTKDLYAGLTRMTKGGPRWTGEVKLVADRLADPLGWKKPQKIFVNSMSDLFHEALTNEQIAAVFGVMAAAPQHQFQILTKRAERMRNWFAWVKADELDPLRSVCREASCIIGSPAIHGRSWTETLDGALWPLPNVWLGVSAEDQPTADERIPLLLATPAAVRWVSAEPLLGPIRFAMPAVSDPPEDVPTKPLANAEEWDDWKYWAARDRGLSWVVVGSESGPGARPMDVAWARAIVDQCFIARVAVFTKQIATPEGKAHGDPKGGDPQYWPPYDWPREFPR